MSPTVDQRPADMLGADVENSCSFLQAFCMSPPSDATVAGRE
jgi:hypothetical protein